MVPYLPWLHRFDKAHSCLDYQLIMKKSFSEAFSLSADDLPIHILVPVSSGSMPILKRKIELSS